MTADEIMELFRGSGAEDPAHRSRAGSVGVERLFVADVDNVAEIEAMVLGITEYYRDRTAPPPEADPVPTPEELAAADNADW
ncbi:hypothetical protein ACFHYQ_20055 [Sphaerimonospora cavernae]|uniref:Uncharacterized protein n=1 Tax=Sphaerimonospora cavernae TaxID=1740611 RepID=A0ABV6U835_9ACTN